MKLLLLMLMLLNPLQALATHSYLKTGYSFTESRRFLIKDGWMPVRMHANDNYEYDGVEKELVTLKILEVESCSIDTSRCIFFYKKNNKCLRLDAMGEHVSIMKIVRWSNECWAP
jgi:hypothetical protein